VQNLDVNQSAFKSIERALLAVTVNGMLIALTYHRNDVKAFDLLHTSDGVVNGVSSYKV
jgi:hypothetical protein